MRALSPKTFAVLAAIAVSAAIGCWGDSCLAPEPTGYSSNWGWMRKCAYAEIFPPHTRNNTTDRALCYCYEVGEPGPEFKLTWKLTWETKLANRTMPGRVFVPCSGNGLVTVDDYCRTGYDNCVAIYDGGGVLLKSYPLEQLYSEPEIVSIPKTASSRWWDDAAKFYFSSDCRYFYVASHAMAEKPGFDTSGKVFRFDMRTGDMDRVPAVEAQSDKCREVTVQRFVLRFSSLTDIMKLSQATSRRQADSGP